MSRYNNNGNNEQSDEGEAEPESNLRFLQAKQRASILWLLSKAFENSIPDDLRDPFYRDHSGEDRLKAYLVQSLANCELYGRALANIYQDPNYNTLSHSQVIHVLMRKGIYIQDPQDSSLTESVLLQTAPIKMSAHLVMIEAVMSLYIKEVLIPAKVIDVVHRFMSVTEEEEIPEEAEDAAIFWINKSCQKFKERIEDELTNDLRGEEREEEEEDPDLVLPSLPPLEYLWDLSDGCSLASLLAFYCPEELSWKEICFNEPMTSADSIYNLQLVEIFCQERLPCDIFFLEVEDLYRCHPVIRPNILAFVADLLFHLEIRPAPCVRIPTQDLFNMLFMTSDDEERFAREEQQSQLQSLNPMTGGRFSSAETKRMSIHTAWDSDESEREKRRRKERRASLKASSSPRRESYRRTMSQGQEHYEGEDIVDSDDLSHYVTAKEFFFDSPSESNGREGPSGPQSLSFSVNKRRKSHLHLQGSHSKSATYSGKRNRQSIGETSGAAWQLADYFNTTGETSSSGEDHLLSQQNHPLNRVNSRTNVSRLSGTVRGVNGSPSRIFRRSHLDLNDPYNRSIHNLPTDALAAASASITDIPRAGLLSRSNSTSNNTRNIYSSPHVMNNSQHHHLLNHLHQQQQHNTTTFVRLSKSRDLLTSPSSLLQAPKKESLVSSQATAAFSPFTSHSGNNHFSQNNSPLYVTSTGGITPSHAFASSSHRSGSEGVGEVLGVGVSPSIPEPLLLSSQGLRLSRQDLRSSHDTLLLQQQKLLQTPRSHCNVNDSSRFKNCLLSGEEPSESLSLTKRSESMAAVDRLGRLPQIMSPFHPNSNGVNSHHLSHQNLSMLMNQTPGSSRTFNLRAIEEELLQQQQQLALIQQQERIISAAAASSFSGDQLDNSFTSPSSHQMLGRMNSRTSLDQQRNSIMMMGNSSQSPGQMVSNEDSPLAADINSIRVMLEEKRKRIEQDKMIQEEIWRQEVKRQSLIHDETLYEQQQQMMMDQQAHGPESLMMSLSRMSLQQDIELPMNGDVNTSGLDQEPVSLRQTPQQQEAQQQQRKSWFIPTDASVVGQDIVTPGRNKGTYLNIPWGDSKGSSNQTSSARMSSTPVNKYTTVNLSKSTSKSVPNVDPIVKDSPQTPSTSTQLHPHPSHELQSPAGFVIGSELSEPKREDEDAMARKKELIMQQSLKRKAEQEAKRVKQQEELARKREEDRKRAEELERKREEEKRRKQQILEEYRMKKVQEEEEQRNGGHSMASTVVVKRVPPAGRAQSNTRVRPKSLHVNSSSMQDYASLDAKPSKVSSANRVTDTVDRSASNSRLFSDVSSFGSSNALAGTGPSHTHMNSTGSSRPPSVISSCSRLTSPPSSSHHLLPSMPPVFQRPRGPPSDGGSETGSAYSEYTGPKLYAKPTQKSNRGIILNAINVVLAGTVNADMKKKVLEEIGKSDSKHFLILFRGAGLQFRAIYSYCPEGDEVTKLHGNGPKNVKNDMIDKFFKYNSGSKNFANVHTRQLSITIDAFTIHNHLWGVGGRRPASMIKLN